MEETIRLFNELLFKNMKTLEEKTENSKKDEATEVYFVMLNKSCFCDMFFLDKIKLLSLRGGDDR